MTCYGVRGSGILRWSAWSALSVISLGCGDGGGELQQVGQAGNGGAGASGNHAGVGGAAGAIGGAGVGGVGAAGGLTTAGAGTSSGGGAGDAAGGGSGGGAGRAGRGTGGKAGRSGDGGAAGALAGRGAGGAAGVGGASGAAGTGPGDSPILAPDDGTLLGFYYGDDSVSETAAKLGRDAPIHLTYYAWTDDWTAGGTRQDLQNGRIPLVNWELFDGGDLAEIVAGEHDEMLAERAASAAALGEPFFLDLGAEMNGDWSPWSGAENGESADLYLAMYRHVHDAFASATNVIWVWCPNVTDEPGATWNEALDYYPGDEYVDWTCVDGYNWGDTGGGGWQSFQEVFENIYPKLASKNKPIMIGEMASAESGGDKAAFIAGMLPALRDDFPLIHALVWFDVNKETDWRVSSSPEAEAAFKTFANDPYMNP